MDIGIYGLGRMGANMVRRLAEDGHRVVAGNRSAGPIEEAVGYGAEGAQGPEEFVKKLEDTDGPRVMWSMLPAGGVTDEMLHSFADLGNEGDIIVDGANSNFRDSIRRSEELTGKGFRYLDAGISGGVWGYEVGYCTMVGGDREAYEHVEPALKTLAPANGYSYLGGAGAGHFSKMVHNGIEYGMLQAYAEGFEILEKSQYDFDLEAVSNLWNQGSVVRSWLLELAERAFANEPHLESVAGYVNDSGEGRWTVQEAINEDVPAPVITESLYARFASRQDESFAAKSIAALRQQFGGHTIKEAGAQESGQDG
jgi:6-phosphogluconate dehydrogenase